jgi:TolB-like protein
MTPEYASPEQARGEPVGPAADIYALGLVLYRLLTGHLPFTPNAAPFARRLDGDLDSIVRNALNQDPGGRYASAAQLSDDLDRFLNDRPVRARKANPAYHSLKFVKRNRLAALLVAALLAASILMLAVSRARRPAAPVSSVAVIPAMPQPAGAPETSILSPLTPAAPKSLAVVLIENRVPDASPERIEDGLRDLLTADLAAAKGIQVISTERVRELMGRRRQGDARLPAGEARDVAREAHADLFLSGALTQAGTLTRLEFRVQETKTGHVLFADKVEGSDSREVVTMAEQASDRVLWLLVPGETALKSGSGAALTASLEALNAYEEGLDHRTRFRARDARRALERAIGLDPNFVMAHYQLADLMRFHGNVPEARRSIARAVQLAEHSDVPRLQKMLAKALQMRLELKLEEAAKILEAAHRRPPGDRTAVSTSQHPRRVREIRRGGSPAGDHHPHGRATRPGARSTRISVRVPERCSPGCRIDRPLCALLPPGNEVPFCSRADAYDQRALRRGTEEFRKINYWGPLAIAAHAGDHALRNPCRRRRNADVNSVCRRTSLRPAANSIKPCPHMKRR